MPHNVGPSHAPVCPFPCSTSTFAQACYELENTGGFTNVVALIRLQPVYAKVAEVGE